MRDTGSCEQLIWNDAYTPESSLGSSACSSAGRDQRS
jgi:hypothetical protein